MSYRNVAIDALSKVMAYDPFFPKPAESVTQAWAEMFEAERLDCKDDVLRAVTLMFREHGDPGFRPTPKMVCEYALTVRKERLAAEAAAAEKAAAIEAAPKITREEWEAKHGRKFPTVGLGKRVPRG